MSSAVPPEGSETPTEALIRFAQELESLVVSFDEANVAHAELGDSVNGAAWWDATRNGLRLSRRTLTGASLRRANLSRADLAGANLERIKGAGLRMHGANLEGTNLSEADLIGADLSQASAGEADFSGALLEDADLHGAHLRFANFTDAIMDGANVSDADLWGVKFDGVAAERANLSRSRLDESSLAKADFSAADLSGASLRKANLTSARLCGSNLRDALLDGACLAGADLTGATLPNISLMTCDLTHARFAGAWLERTRMRASQLGGQAGEEVAGDLDAALESYIVLERNFLSLGSSEDASWAYRRKRRVGRQLHYKTSAGAFNRKEWGRFFVSAAEWLGDVSAEWLCDYGESLGRVARAFFTILILFALLYWVSGSLTTREGFHSRHIFTAINYLLFSLDSMTTVGTSEVALRPSGELGILLSSLQTVLGTILLGLFGFVLGARIRS